MQIPPPHSDATAAPEKKQRYYYATRTMTACLLTRDQFSPRPIERKQSPFYTTFKLLNEGVFHFNNRAHRVYPAYSNAFTKARHGSEQAARQGMKTKLVI